MIWRRFPGDELDPAVEQPYRAAIDRHWPETPAISRFERFAFMSAQRALCCGDDRRNGQVRECDSEEGRHARQVKPEGRALSWAVAFGLGSSARGLNTEAPPRLDSHLILGGVVLKS